MGDFCDLQRSGGLKQESVTFDSLWGVTKGKGGIPGAQGDSRSATFEKGAMVHKEGSVSGLGHLKVAVCLRSAFTPFFTPDPVASFQ